MRLIFKGHLSRHFYVARTIPESSLIVVKLQMPTSPSNERRLVLQWLLGACSRKSSATSTGESVGEGTIKLTDEIH